MLYSKMRPVCFSAASISGLALLAAPLLATTWFVPSQCPTIQAGIDSAAVGDTVLVAPGVYTSCSTRVLDLGAGPVSVSANVFLKSGVVLVSEQGCAVTTIDGEGARTVAVAYQIDTDATMCGFTMTNGIAVPYRWWICGAGLFCYESSPLIKENHIVGNWAGTATIEGGGGGIYCIGSGCNPIIQHNIVENNQARSAGGIGSRDGAQPVVIGNIIRANECWNSGAGVSTYFGSFILRDNLIISNYNHANVGGGAKFDESTPPTFPVTGNTFAWNYAAEGGGGVACHWSCSPEFQNNIFFENTCPLGDGAVRCAYGATPSFQCNDFFGNSDPQLSGACGTVIGVHGNFAADPSFCDAASGDFSLATNSPCLPGNHPAGWDCGLIGALGQGCGPVALQPSTWAVIKARYR
jgi:hypothetical protein